MKIHFTPLSRFLASFIRDLTAVVRPPQCKQNNQHKKERWNSIHCAIVIDDMFFSVTDGSQAQHKESERRRCPLSCCGVMAGFKECTTTIFRGNCVRISAWLLFAHDFVGWSFFVTIESSAVWLFSHTNAMVRSAKTRRDRGWHWRHATVCSIVWWSNAILKEPTNSICMWAGNCEDGKNCKIFMGSPTCVWRSLGRGHLKKNIRIWISKSD